MDMELHLLGVHQLPDYQCTTPTSLLFCKNAIGESVCVRVWSIPLFCFISTNKPLRDEGFASLQLSRILQQSLDAKYRDSRSQTSRAQCTLTRDDAKRDAFGYVGSGDTRNCPQFYHCALQSRDALRAFADVINISSNVILDPPPHHRDLDDACTLGDYAVKVYESDLDESIITLRNMQLTPNGWFTLGTSKCTISADQRLSFCQHEFSVKFGDMIAKPVYDRQWSQVAPLRVLSFDIEVASVHSHRFPSAKRHDPVIQIGCVEFTYDDRLSSIAADEIIRAKTKARIFLLKDCEPVDNVDVQCFEEESDLLTAFFQYIVRYDPDVITGYNIQNFDFPYCIERCVQLNLTGRRGGVRFSRLTNYETCAIESVFHSNQTGARLRYKIPVPGRAIVDMYAYVQQNCNFETYTLNNVSRQLLGGRCKHELSYAEISASLTQGARERAVVARYCIEDCNLPALLLLHMSVIERTVELARLTHVPMDMLLTRGQSLRGLACFTNMAYPRDFLIPNRATAATVTADTGKSYTGATVIKPIVGFYREAIPTLDFASLYPSIMMANNLCFSTLLLRGGEDAERFGLDVERDCFVSSEGDWFVREHVRRGLLPTILHELVAARKAVKTAMEEAEKSRDVSRIKMLNMRQGALKVTSNSIYGITGSDASSLHCKAIAQSTTACGRAYIETTKTYIEQNYKKNRLLHVHDGGVDFTVTLHEDASVIYGDTDSVMVRLHVRNVKTAVAIGQHMADEITALFPPPLKLNFEKAYSPYLLQGKKRYAGLLYTSASAVPRMDCKGLQTVRRDSCKLISETYSECLRLTLHQSDPRAALQFACSVLKALLAREVAFDKLILTRGLNRIDTNTPHAVLYHKLLKRDQTSAPILGDRIPFVIVDEGGGQWRGKLSTLSEDPMYALDRNLPLNISYYADCLERVIRAFFSIILDAKVVGKELAHAKLVSFRSRSRVFGCEIEDLTNHQTSNRKRRVYATASSSDLGQRQLSIVNFVNRRPRCVQCRAVAAENCSDQRRYTLCSECLVEKTAAVSVEREKCMEKLERLKIARDQYWNICENNCTIRKDVAAKDCKNANCNNYIPRRCANEALDQQEEIARAFDQTEQSNIVNLNFI